MTIQTKISLAIASTLFLAFLACNNLNLEPNTQTENSRYLKFRNRLYRLIPPVEEEVLSEKSSVTMANGKYIIDTSVIRENRNKKMLLDGLSRSYLAKKKDLSEIPDFIKAFLDSISDDRKFEIVNPGVELETCTSDCRHGFSKVYDQNKKDTVMTLIWYGKHYSVKQMVYFGIGKNLAILSHHEGGSLQITVIKFEDKKIVDFWYGDVWNGSVAPLNVTTQAEIIKQMKLLGTSRGGGC